MRFDVIHTHSTGSAGMEAVRLADRMHVPLVGTFHPKYIREYLTSAQNERDSRLAKLFAFDYFSRCDEIWTTNEEARELLLERGFQGNIEVFDNGTELEPVDAEARRRAREEFHLSNLSPYCCLRAVWSGRRTCRACWKRRPSSSAGTSVSNCSWPGAGRTRRISANACGPLNLTGTVRLLGYITDESLLGGLYAESALCLFPAQQISAGFVVREAAAQGTPSLVIAGSAPSSLIENGVNGLTCADTPGEYGGRDRELPCRAGADAPPQRKRARAAFRLLGTR